MLSDKIWITRKARIYAEERLRRYAYASEIMTIIYSLALVFITIWNLEYKDSRFEQLAVFASILILVLSVFMSSQKFTERALAMRNCYVKLDELYSRVKRAEATANQESLQQLESEYTGLLLNIENHSADDFLCLRYSLRHDATATLPPFTRGDWRRYVCARLLWGGLMVLLIALPIIVVVVVVA